MSAEAKEELSQLKPVLSYGEKIVAGSIEEIDCLIRAQVPIIQIVTHEEDRLVREVSELICLPRDKDLYVWSSYRGLAKYSADNDYFPTRAKGDLVESWNPQKALQALETVKHKTSESKSIVFIMKDFHTVLSPAIARQLRDLYNFLAFNRKTLIIMGGSLTYGPNGQGKGIEPTLEKQIIVTNYSLPVREAIDKHLRETVTAINQKDKVKTEYSDDEYYQFSRALQGLTYVEIDNAVAVSLTHLQRLDHKKLLNEKKQIITRSGILEYIDTNSNFNEVGGMDEMKSFFKNYANAHSKEAEEFGVEPLKGVLFVGLPGGGKSLTAKAVGNLWGIPTLRLDVGKVMQGLVGASEQRMREALASASAVAPTILWLDEVEKALSGTKSSNSSDGGTIARVFGTLLTAMQEGLKDVVVIATANDISALPPELIRRFSEVFFVDLPVEEEREEIIKIHLNKKKRDVSDFNLLEIIKASDGYTGAEIEKAIKESIARCFTEEKRKLTTEDIVQSLKDTKPISVVMSEKINDMRTWAKDRARYASSLAAKAAGKHIVKTKTKTMSVDDALSDMPEMKNKDNKEVKVKHRINNID